MNKRQPNKARTIGVGVLTGLAAVLLYGPDQATRSLELGPAGAVNAPEPAERAVAGLAQIAVEESSEATAQLPEGLPADAGVLPVETIEWGGSSLEVAAREMLVHFSPDLSREGQESLLRQLGAARIDEVSLAGYVRVRVPEGRPLGELIGRLSLAEGVTSVRPNVLMAGTANRCNLAGQYYGYQWHLGRFNHTNSCNTRPNDPVAITVAVLDTGVAYETYGAYVKAADLTGVPIVAPRDFVNDDTHANDDHQHGTHVATTILGVGKINGVTPGATLMPVKVLDASNRGSEFALAQGIRWAVDNGARLINMSLSFPSSYVPSGVLQDAVTYAANANVLMIASSGNGGLDIMPYPAAFREVLSVGATRMKRLSGGTIVDEVASYSNTGPGLDLVAPGGSLAHDANLDGWPDGILAQTIRLQTPGSTAYYFYAGTSQAAATVSGIATWLMAAGADSAKARDVLLETAIDLGEPGYDDQTGQGLVNLDAALSFFAGQNPSTTPSTLANIVPVVYKSGGNEWAVARIRIQRPNGTAIPNAIVYGRWSGSVSSKAIGIADAQGWLTLTSPAVADGPDGSIFAIELNTIVDPAGGRRSKPKEFYYMSQGLQALMTGILADGATQDSLLVFEALPSDTSLGSMFDVSKLSRSFVVKTIGPTLGTPGIGIVFTPDFIPGLEDETLAGQDIAINFGAPKAFGDAVVSSSSVRVYNGGVGLRSTSFSYSGGVGLRSTSFSRLGGVGMMSMTMTRAKLDSAMISGMSADASPVEIVVNEDASTFLASNAALDGTSVGISLNETRCAANSSDVAAMDGMVTAASAEEAESLLSNELGMADGMLEFEGAPPTGLIVEE